MKKILRRLDSTGDTAIEFDPDVKTKPASKATDEARALFERLTAKEGAIAFNVNRGDGKPDEKITKFGQIENETILVPKIVGG